MKLKGLTVNVSNYTSCYKGQLKPGESLDTLYERFNLYHLEGFTGHFLAVSDVILIENGGEKKAFYVDSVGFTKVDDFFVERFGCTETEMQIISDFRQKIGKYFCPVNEKSAKEIEDMVREFLLEEVWEYDLPIQIGEIMVYGSWCRGMKTESSDIDIVVEYQGMTREDQLFNLFDEDELYIGECKVDCNPIKEEKSGNIAELLERATKYMELEMAFSSSGRYIQIQEVYDGYEYTIYGGDFEEIDGGVYDNPDISIYVAINDIVEHLKKNPDTNGSKGKIKEHSELTPINLEELEKAVEESNYIPLRITFTVAECGQFHHIGRYRDNIDKVDEAVAFWKTFQNGCLNGVPSIGIRCHTLGIMTMEDEQVDIVFGKWLDIDMVRYYPTL